MKMIHLLYHDFFLQIGYILFAVCNKLDGKLREAMVIQRYFKSSEIRQISENDNNTI